MLIKIWQFIKKLFSSIFHSNKDVLPKYFYVSTSGNDSNSGLTPEKAWKTIEHALANIKLEYTIALKKGDVWLVDNCISIAGKHGTADNHIVIDGSLWGEGGNAVLRCNSPGGDNPKWYGILNIVDSSHIAIQSIEIDGNGMDNRSGVIVGGAYGMYGNTNQNNEAFISVRDCYIHHIGNGKTYQMAMLIQTWYNDMSDIFFINNTIDFVSNHGIAVYPGKTSDGATPCQILRPVVRSNKVEHYGLKNDGVHSGILLNNQVTDAIVEYNTCIPGEGGHGSAFAINCNESVDGNTVIGALVRYNDFRTNDEVYQCIMIQNNIPGLSSVFIGEFHNNKLYAGTTHLNQGNCVLIYSFKDSDIEGSDLNFHDNTMISKGGVTFYQAAPSPNILIFNDNILINNGVGGDYENLVFKGIAECIHWNNTYWKSTGVKRQFLKVGGKYYMGEQIKSMWEETGNVIDPGSEGKTIDIPEVTVTAKSGFTVKQSTKLSTSEFVDAFEPFAIKTEQSSGINKLAILAQAAWESGWNKSSPGWMFFGVKDTDGINGNEQLLTTTEYSKRQDLNFPEVISITPVVLNGQKYFKYIVKEYFRRYDSPGECFDDHTKFFFVNKRYQKALEFRHDPNRFIEEIAIAGYATAPNYADNLKSVVKTIQKYTT